MRPGRKADAEQAYRDAAAAGNPTAVRALALWLGEQGRQAEADRITAWASTHTAAQSRRILIDEVNRQAEPRMVVESCRTALLSRCCHW
jgi:hypothetical protein